LREHGQPAARLEEGIAEALVQMGELARLGIDMEMVGHSLQVDGVNLFEASFQKLLLQTG